jgi:ankyrin repeat protein
MLGFSQKEKDAVLRAAFKSESRDVIKKALARGGNPNGMMDEERQIPFIVWAADQYYYSSTSEKMIEILLDAKVDVNAVDKSGNTALHRAIYHRSNYPMQKLLNAGANPLAKNSNGDTPFNMAVRNEQWQVVSTMLEKGALEQMKAADDYADTAIKLLYSAVDNKAGGWLVSKLLPEIADINAGADRGRALLHLVAKRGEESLLLKLLERPEANINLKDRAGRTALFGAVLEEKADIAKLLMDRGAKVSVADSKGVTPLVLAAQKGSIPLMRQMIKKIEEEKQKPDLDAALLAAAAEGHARAVEMIVHWGANKEAVNDKGETALILAAQGNHLEAVKMLTVKLEVDTQAADKTDLIAYDHAKAKGHKELSDYLIKYQPGYVPPPPPPPPIDTSRFVKTSDSSIDVKERGLTMTFNFWTQQVIYREPEKGGISVVRNFDEIQRREAIVEAYETLKRLGGHPPEFASVEVQKAPMLKKPSNG